MGLDAVEIVLRTEDLFSISITNEEASQVNTVRDLYQLVCRKLLLLPLASPQTSVELPVITQKKKARIFGEYHTPLPAPANVLPWTPQTVWDCLVAIFVDQMLMEPDEVRPNARIAEDLGIC